jgi:SAM-dependent methyltransferase
MTLEEHLDKLKRDPASSAIAGDRAFENKYMQGALFRWKHTLKAIPVSAEPLRVLDIGATPFTIIVKREFPHYRIFTVDLTELLKERCDDEGIELRTCNLDAGKLPFDSGAFDVVIFTQVLEHVFFPPTELLREVRRVLGVSGKLLLSVPNIAGLSNRLRLLFGRTVLQDADGQFQVNSNAQMHGHGHLHEYTRHEIASICRSAGFTVVNTKMVAPSPSDIRRYAAGWSAARFAYYSILAFAPNFRPIIEIACQK